MPKAACTWPLHLLQVTSRPQVQLDNQQKPDLWQGDATKRSARSGLGCEQDAGERACCCTTASSPAQNVPRPTHIHLCPWISAPGKPLSHAPWPARCSPRRALCALAAGRRRNAAAPHGLSVHCMACCVGCRCRPAVAARVAPGPNLRGRDICIFNSCIRCCSALCA